MLDGSHAVTGPQLDTPDLNNQQEIVMLLIDETSMLSTYKS